MKKIILLISTLLTCGPSFAYTQCPEVAPPVILIRFVDSEPKIVMEKSYKEMTSDANIIYSNIHVLGKYSPHFKSNSNVQLMYRALGGSVCAKVTKFEINVVMEPEIFISKEILNNQCLRDRVIRHEKLHHGFAVNAGNKMSVYGYNLAKQFTNKDYIGFSREEVDREVENNKNKLVERIKNYLINEEEAQDKTIDNEENYKNETKICPNFGGRK